jgi:hypothetical protein
MEHMVVEVLVVQEVLVVEVVQVAVNLEVQAQ